MRIIDIQDWSLTTIAQTFQQRAKAAVEQASNTEDQYLRFAWEQVAVSYANLAKRCSDAQTASDSVGIQVRETHKLRASLLTTATACHEHGEAMHLLAQEEGNEGKRQVMLAISNQYYVLHDDLLVLERLISRPFSRTKPS